MSGKNNVTSAAYLAVCPYCEMHACIVLPDGRKTQHFGSRKVGREVIVLLAKGGCIDAEEVVYLCDQLAAAPFLRDKTFPGEEIVTLEEVFRPECADDFDEGHGEPPTQYIM